MPANDLAQKFAPAQPYSARLSISRPLEYETKSVPLAVDRKTTFVVVRMTVVTPVARDCCDRRLLTLHSLADPFLNQFGKLGHRRRFEQTPDS